MKKTTYAIYLTFITIIVFLPSLRNGFVWDDRFLLLNNPYVRSWSFLPRIFTTQLYAGSDIVSNFYRPLQLVSYIIDYSVWGINPFGYHLTSLFLHTGCAILLYLIMLRLGLRMPYAFIGSALFALSPGISGITYYISARSDLLAAFFLLASFLSFTVFVKEKRKGMYFISLFFYILSMASKEMGIILGAFILLAMFFYGLPLRKKIIYFSGYLFIALLYVISRLTILNFNQGGGAIEETFASSIPLYNRLITDIKILPKYIRLLLVPYGLHMDWYIRPARSFLERDILVSSFITAFFLFLIVKACRRSTLILFGILWFFIGLFPVLNIYPVSLLFGEGWLYIPAAGFYIAAASLLETINYRKTPRNKWAAVALATVLLYYTMVTVSYGRVWRNNLSLFSNVIKNEKDSPFLFYTYNNIGLYFQEKGDPGEAAENYRRAIRLNKRYAPSYNNLGTVYTGQGRNVKAIWCFKKAIQLKEDYLTAYTNLSHAYEIIGRNERAIYIALEALRRDPRFYKACINLGYLYSGRGNIATAIEYFKKAAGLRPYEFEPHYALGTLYAKRNNLDGALRQYRMALATGTEPDFNFYNDLAYVYLHKGMYKEAEAALLESVSLNPDQADPYNNLGNLYSLFGYFELAMEEYRKALDNDPRNNKIMENAVKTKSEWKKILLKKERKI